MLAEARQQRHPAFLATLEGGIRSVDSLEKLLKPNWRQRDFGDEPYPPRWWLNAGTTDWKRDRYDWGLLNGYWRSDNRFY